MCLYCIPLDYSFIDALITANGRKAVLRRPEGAGGRAEASAVGHQLAERELLSADRWSVPTLTTCPTDAAQDKPLRNVMRVRQRALESDERRRSRRINKSEGDEAAGRGAASDHRPRLMESRGGSCCSSPIESTAVGRPEGGSKTGRVLCRRRAIASISISRGKNGTETRPRRNKISNQSQSNACRIDEPTQAE